MAVIQAMFQAVIFFTFSAFIRAALTTQNSFEGLLEDVTSCRDSCERTFPLHTYPKPSHLQSCRRGCRFFAMMDFVEGAGSDFNETTQLCKSTCMDAYRAGEELDACTLGCDNQVPFAIEEHKKWEKEEPNIHILMPFMSLQSIYQQMMTQAQGFSMKSWSVFMWGDNGQIYVYETKPELDIFTVDPEAQQSALRGVAKTARTFETNLQVQNQHHGYMEANRGGYPTDNESYGWLDCVSKKSGLPRWLLSVTIFLSALAMIWLCCATTATAPDQKLTVQKLSINGDLEYLNECKKYPHPVYIKTVEAHKCAINQDDDDDVEPLPLHVDIGAPQTKI